MVSAFKPNKAFTFSLVVPNDRFPSVWKAANASGEMLSADIVTGVGPPSVSAAAAANSFAISAAALSGKTDDLPIAGRDEVRGNFTFRSIEGPLTTLASAMEDQDRASLFKMFWVGEGE